MESNITDPKEHVIIAENLNVILPAIQKRNKRKLSTQQELSTANTKQNGCGKACSRRSNP